ncbi:MAG TPA: hypothetical protein VNK70_00550 [Candidatus Paceibacterota bacterium]|nr:hypothetical protein [Candidatus Paceibacterota bacterium]
METKFFTGKGDDGRSRVNGREVSKSNPMVDFLGGLDELNSWLGFCRLAAEKFTEVRPPSIDGNFGSSNLPVLDVAGILKKIQNFLFIAQAEAAALGFGYEKSPKITEEEIKYFEEVIAEIDRVVPKIEKFVMAGGTELSARLDVGRAIARRVERQAKRYEPDEPEKCLTPATLKFLNRLSSVLFALARYVNHASGVKEEHPTYEL